MKKALLSLLVLVLAICFTVCSTADSKNASSLTMGDIKEAIKSWKTDDIKALVDLVLDELQDRGYATGWSYSEDPSTISVSLPTSISSLTDTSADSESSQIVSSSDTDNDTIINSSERSDISFIADLSAALNDRLRLFATEDTSHYSDNKLIDYYFRLTEPEMAVVEKYSDYVFEDSQLGDYAKKYFMGIKVQSTAMQELLDGKEEQAILSWESGLNVRSKYLYLISKEYHIEVSSELENDLQELLQHGKKQIDK